MNNRKIVLIVVVILIGTVFGLWTNCSSGCGGKDELLIVSDKDATALSAEGDGTDIDTGSSSIDKDEELTVDKSTEVMNADETVSTASASDNAARIKGSCEVVVFVCGAVVNPGVYNLQQGDRVSKAIDKAGGFADDADINYLNLALELTDGMKIYVPSIEETSQIEVNYSESGNALSQTDGYLNGQVSSDSNGLVNINTATVDELMSITGIGEAKAKSIVAYRNEHGRFISIEGIMNIPGIKEGLFNKIKDKISV